MERTPIYFSDEPVCRVDMVLSARSFLGIKYSISRNYVARNEDGEINFEKSSLNCFGFLLAVARDVKLLPESFDLARGRWKAGQTLDQALWELLTTNYVRVKKEFARPSDVLLMWYRDVNKDATQPHHVAILTQAATKRKPAKLIHAVENNPSLSGAVKEVEINALERRRIHSVWRLKSIHNADTKRALYRAK